MHSQRDKRTALRVRAAKTLLCVFLLSFQASAQTAPNRPQRTVQVVASGDVLIHRRVAASATAHQTEGGFAWVLAPIASEIPADAFAVLNLETPLSERYHPPGNFTPPVLGADPSLAAALAGVGFDALSLSNNHAYDQTAEGLFDTMTAARAARLGFAGAGTSIPEADAPLLVDRGGVRLAFLAFTDRVNGSPGNNPHGVRIGYAPDGVRVTEAVRAARARADVVVLSMHWSHDFVRSPTSTQRTLARNWIDAGVDLLLGTGPHVLQRVERMPSPRGEAVVAYSLGNFLSNQGVHYRVGARGAAHDAEFNPAARDGALLRVSFVSDASAAANARVRVSALEAVPLWTENDSPTGVRAAPLRRASAPVRAERRAAIAAALGPAVTLVE